MMRLRQIYGLGWALVLAALIVGGHADTFGRFVGSAITAWVVYSVPFGITFMMARGARDGGHRSHAD
ncbi:MAG TPA: hypothetical protein VGY99_30375 [Candidatus Binataceae bacterium]|jgi:hypothetical protein|nr:hypothetical protein [Candidatus Binataceae bacterium]